MFWPCETKTSTCRNFATISSGLYRFLAITVLLDVKDIPQVGLLQRGRISRAALTPCDPRPLLTVCGASPITYLHRKALAPSCPKQGRQRTRPDFPVGQKRRASSPEWTRYHSEGNP